MKNPQSAFDLSGGSNLVLDVVFTPGKASNHDTWPLARKIYKHGTINIKFSNGDS